MAGIIGATANNGKGTAGLLWDTSIYASNFNAASAYNVTTYTYILCAVVDEIIAGAKAVNISIGRNNAYSPSKNPNPYTSPYSEATLDRDAEYCGYMLAGVIEDGKEFVIVQSAGNGVQDTRLGYTYGENTTQSYDWYRSVDAFQNGLFCSVRKKAYEDTGYSDGGVTLEESSALYDRVIIVGAAENQPDETGDQRFRMWRQSNGGSRVDIYAPGVSVMSSCVDTNGTQSLLAKFSGTSQAAPAVTAVAGACFAINPNLTGAQVKRIICLPSNSDRVVADNTQLFPGTPASSNAELEYHPFTGDGRMLNMKLCVEEALRSVSTRADYTILNRRVGIANSLVPTDYTNFVY